MTAPYKAREGIYIAFDFGMKYIGTAVGQGLTQSASPLITLKAQDGIPAWPEIATLLESFRPQALIVGIPVNMDGREQNITYCARAFVRRLTVKFALPIYTVDERLSSWAAKQRLNIKNPKKPRDIAQLNAMAAVILLEQWLLDNPNFEKN